MSFLNTIRFELVAMLLFIGSMFIDGIAAWLMLGAGWVLLGFGFIIQRRRRKQAEQRFQDELAILMRAYQNGDEQSVGKERAP